MSTEGIFVAIFMTGVVLLLILLPLLRRGATAEPTAVVGADALKQRDRLLVYYERVINNIRDLDEDFSTGKVNQEDYDSEREMWLGHGVQTLKALDELDADIAASVPVATSPVGQQQQPPPVVVVQQPAQSVDERIEAAVAERRKKA